jgi:streptogrisin C
VALGHLLDTLRSSLDPTGPSLGPPGASWARVCAPGVMDTNLATTPGNVAAQLAGDVGIDGVFADVQAAELVVVANPSTPPDAISTLNASSLDVDSGNLTTQSSSATARTRAPAGLSVRVERSSGQASNQNRGGLPVTSCTTGFTVQGSSATGFVTAGHCPNTLSYAVAPTEQSLPYSAPFIAEIKSNLADLQWNTTPAHTDYAAFWGSSPRVATARTGIGVAYVGQGLCHRGSVSGYTCGYVTSTTFAPAWANACSTPCTASFVRVEGSALASLGGDSGGPWFAGGAAYGIHMGGSHGEIAAWSVYTPVSRLSTLNISLL